MDKFNRRITSRLKAIDKWIEDPGIKTSKSHARFCLVLFGLMGVFGLVFWGSVALANRYDAALQGFRIIFISLLVLGFGCLIYWILKPTRGDDEV